MMVCYFVYGQDGAILRTGICPESMVDLQAGEGEFAGIGEANDAEQWVDEQGAIQPKQDYTLDALPLPCTVHIEGVAYQVTEPPEFEFDAPGTYAILVDAGPRYLQKEFVIENTPLLT